jgi:pyruvate dehydrogenase E2 component (dihydrolipoamide acetyltransferase)
MPKLGMYNEDILLLEWSVAEGAAVARGETVFVLETEKTTAEVEAEADGFVHRQLEAGTKVVIGTQVAVIAGSREEYQALTGEPRPAGRGENNSGGESKEGEEANPFLGYIDGGGPTAIAAAGLLRPAAEPASPAPAERSGRVLASPRALATARRHGLDGPRLSEIRGSGPGGRILERDVLAQLSAGPAAAEPVAAAVAERIPLRGRRGTIARRLTDSLLTTAQLTSVLEIDASGLVSERGRLNADVDAPRVSYTTLLVWLLARTLRRHPLLNSRIEDDVIEVLSDINIGVAVDTPDGLIVPVVHGADELSVPELNARIGALVGRARAGKLALAELENGTFTLSNAGIYPVDITTAILNPPQSALLWVGRIRERPLVIAGGLHIRPTFQACLTFDHRAIDGSPAAEFLGTLETLIASLAAHGSGESA